ncbi:MAG: lactate utilization protein [Planctomycetia bacterium]|jgi:L-lactate dehydrogenase complex protein LldG
MSDDRDIVLGRIREALSDRPEPELPPVPEVWPSTNPSLETMLQQFEKSLVAVQGELHHLPTMADAQAKLRELMNELQTDTVVSVDREATRQVTEGFGEAVHFANPDWTPDDIAQYKLGMIVSDYLLADTGSCLVASETPNERLLCYLPPACIVIARTNQLREHLPDAWREVAERTADPNLRGEYVFITGPSRTADIEKILILGVHGPQRLIVLLVD